MPGNLSLSVPGWWRCTTAFWVISLKRARPPWTTDAFTWRVCRSDGALWVVYLRRSGGDSCALRAFLILIGGCRGLQCTLWDVLQLSAPWDAAAYPSFYLCFLSFFFVSPCLRSSYNIKPFGHFTLSSVTPAVGMCNMHVHTIPSRLPQLCTTHSC